MKKEIVAILTEEREPAWDSGELAKQYADLLNRIAAEVGVKVEFKGTTKGSKR